MYERFSDPARRAMQSAKCEALRMCHEYVGTEHVLIALASEPDGVARSVLQALRIDADQVRERVARIVSPGPSPPIKLKTSWWMSWRRSALQQTPRTKRVIEAAKEEVRATGATYVGTEHLLLGLSRVTHGVAAQVLQECGAGSETLAALIAQRHRAGITESAV